MRGEILQERPGVPVRRDIVSTHMTLKTRRGAVGVCGEEGNRGAGAGERERERELLLKRETEHLWLRQDFNVCGMHED